MNTFVDKLKAYQKGSMDGFVSKKQGIDDEYVKGISITLGSPRKHVWTYAVGLSDNYDYECCNCPCTTHPGPPPPAFVGNDYYCESGDVRTYESPPYYLSDPLWDSAGCSQGNGCCARIGMPRFYRRLPLPANEDFEIHICQSLTHGDEDVAVEKLELYILN